jgi:hypothetical protein
MRPKPKLIGLAERGTSIAPFLGITGIIFIDNSLRQLLDQGDLDIAG